MRMVSFFVALVLFGSCLADEAAGSLTNGVVKVGASCSVSNSPVLKLPRQQCEAMTKSGTRCKRNAVPGERLCRQHKKSGALKKGLDAKDVRGGNNVK